MFRIKATPWYSVLLSLAVACSSSDGTAPTAPTPPPSSHQPASDDPVAQGVTVVSKDANGAPRLIRTITPRPTKVAGLTHAQAAREHVASLAGLYVKKNAPTTLVDKSTQTLRNGASVVTLKQQVDGIDVHNGDLRVLVQADGSLSAISGTLAPASGKQAFQSTATQAIEHALDRMFGANRTKTAITAGPDKNGWQQFTVADAADYRVRSVRVKREVSRVGADRFEPSWIVEVTGQTLPGARSYLAPRGEMNARRYAVSDRDGAITLETNLVKRDSYLYRAFADANGNRRPNDGSSSDFSPHPTGTPDGTLPPNATANLVAMDSFNGPHDSWLPSNATTTAGNNAEAYADRAAPEGFSPGDVRPLVTTGRVLNYVYNHALEPAANDTQSSAAVVNSFFIVNWLHDWYYDSGFTEVTGNAQQSNYGRGGLENDRIVVHSQAFTFEGGQNRNNALMFTPADGESPEMYMFTFETASEQKLVTPTGTLEASYVYNGPRSFNVTGSLVLANDGVGNPGDACEPLTNNLTGKVALLDWTLECSQDDILLNAKNAGATAAVIVFPLVDEVPFPFTVFAENTLPTISVSNADGQALKAAVATAPLSVTVRRRVSRTETAGDLDNGIVAHEWGHYLHHRLAVCETNELDAECDSMSEGWGDFNSLFVLLRDGDNRAGSFGMGVPALSGNGFAQYGLRDPGYFGIRRYPYSTDKNKNPLSYRHITNASTLPTDVPVNEILAASRKSEVHNAGEVWATQLWDSYNALIDAHGLATARRRMSDYVVLGLLLTPPNASFLEGRDALLTAAGALDSDDQLLLAAGFANRGSGSCALPKDEDGLVVESSTLAAQLAVGAASLSDDGVTCDADGYLDAGETGYLRFTIANGGVLDAESLVATASSTTPGLEFGEPVLLDKVGKFSSVEVAVPVTVTESAPTNAFATIDVTVTSEFACETSLSFSVTQKIGADDVANSSATDHFDAQTSPWTAPDDIDGVWGIATLDGNPLLFGANAPFTSDTSAITPPLAVGNDPFTVGFNLAYSIEASSSGSSFYDGAVVELSTDAGASWADVTSYGANPAYSGVISVNFDNPLAGRPAYSGISPNFPTLAPLALDFGSQFAGQSVQLRFRMATDFCCAFTGLLVDDVSIGGITNLPFTNVVPEPSTCDAYDALLVSGETARHAAPRNSLQGYDLTIEE